MHACIMMGGRVFSICTILTLLLQLRCSFEDHEHGRPFLTSPCAFRSPLELGNQIFVARNPVLAVSSTLSLGALNIVVRLVNNSCDFAGNYQLSSWSWNVTNDFAGNHQMSSLSWNVIDAPANRTSGCLAYVVAHPRYQRRFRIRRLRCPCALYSNTTATFHALLIGDLVFKLNPVPGPVGERIPVIVSTRSGHKHRAQSTTSLRNVININCSAGSPLNGHFKHPMSFCTLNARSVKNNSADLLDYICDYNVDLFAITETWLSADDAAVRAELCPDGYKFIDQPRVGCRGGGTGLVHRDLLGVKKIVAGEKDSFEFSEWTVTSYLHNLRVVIIYRPPCSRRT